MPMGRDSFCSTDHRKKAAKLLPKKCEGMALSCEMVLSNAMRDNCSNHAMTCSSD